MKRCFLCLVDHKRKISKAFARELRKRGWLHSEGYAPSSWAAQQ